MITYNTKTILKCTILVTLLSFLFTNLNVFSQQNKFGSKNELQAIAVNSWNKYKLRFMKNDERVQDQDDLSTTSEGQSYSLLRAIMINDRNVFDRTYKWSKKHLQIRKNDNLFAWRTNVNDYGETYNTQTMNATDADLDIGLALIMADHKWSSNGNVNYGKEARDLIPDIFEQRVVNVGGDNVILPFNSQKWRGIEIINPSYFNPAAYRQFQSYDPKHNWNELADDTYKILSKITNYTGLVPDWVEFNYNNNRFEYSPKNLRSDDDNFGYEAFRTYYRVGIDYTMHNSYQAKQFLDKAKGFFEQEIKSRNRISPIYSKYGTSLENRYEDMTTISSTYFIFKHTNSPNLSNITNDKIYTRINRQNMQFNDYDRYYSSSWGWFAFADLAGITLNNSFK